MRYVLLLFLAACSSTPHMLADGAPLAPVEPRVTYTPTGTGLPEYWGAPEPQRPERSPHKRVLPQTPATMKEPGVWAAKDPDEDGDDGPVLFGISLPPMSDAETPEDIAPAVRCANTMFDAALNAGTLPTIAKAPEAVRRCIAAALYARCAAHSVQRDRIKSTPATHELGAIRRNAETARSARRFERESCTGAVIDPPTTAAANATLNKWLETWGR